MRRIQITELHKVIDDKQNKVLCPMNGLSTQCTNLCAWFNRVESIVNCGSKVIGEINELDRSSKNTGD